MPRTDDHAGALSTQLYNGEMTGPYDEEYSMWNTEYVRTYRVQSGSLALAIALPTGGTRSSGELETWSCLCPSDV